MTLPLLCLSCEHGAATPTSYHVGVVICTHPSKTTEKDKVVTNCLHCKNYSDAKTEPLTFTEDQIHLILNGRKNGTMRRTKHGEIGDIFYIAGIPYRIVSIQRTYRGIVPFIHWRHEGCSSTDDANKLLNEIYPDLSSETIVYYHTFAAVISKDNKRYWADQAWQHHTGHSPPTDAVY